jgi:hypothetical protein
LEKNSTTYVSTWSTVIIRLVEKIIVPT